MLGRLALTALLTARSLAGQTLTPPAPPDEAYYRNVTSIVKEWTFSGCGTGVVQDLLYQQPVRGTPFCAGGRVTLGVAQWPFPETGNLAVSVNYAVDPRVFLDESGATVYGTRTDATCPTGCPWNWVVDGLFYRIDAANLDDALTMRASDLPSLSLTSVELGIGYGLRYVPGGQIDGSRYGARITAQLTAVPEPATVTLLGVGLATLAVGTWRRRRGGEGGSA